ncbi:Pc09g00210 [Penicillium rubens Wisconsin 54-1255]|uniref:Pc09g00210 protein n=1 Tax=Penicillium rubens (strain ATCC 28089 / DSM 1075 / NRRL 1951 / Wisconsin 54-1255) TaxID=500485 RepID=B6GWL7_PENRW|nr:Pc09g00210 [Penicillium rubens Wisconsin 54-1255]
MNRAKTKHTRPSTVWLDESAFRSEQLSPNSTASPHIQPPTIQKMATAVITPGSMEPHPGRPNARILQLNQNPWDTFEPAAGSSQDRSLIFARNKSERGKLVHIQQLEKQFSPATGFLELMEQVAHPSFLKLLECYHHDASCTLIWEPTEVSVSHILASSCSITTDELVGIVKPVLEGIQYLRGLGRALATLGPETILLTQSGDVKIMGVENSCEIKESEMNPATMKLCALADVVTKLMLKNRTYEWETEIQNLPCQLESISVEEILQNEMFTRDSCEGELKLLVSVANKTAYHGIKSYYARC